MGMKGQKCSGCGNKSYWKRNQVLEISIYDCRKCGNRTVHYAISGLAISELWSKKDAGIPLTDDEMIFFTGVQIIHDNLLKFADEELIMEKRRWEFGKGKIR